MASVTSCFFFFLTVHFRGRGMSVTVVTTCVCMSLGWLQSSVEVPNSVVWGYGSCVYKAYGSWKYPNRRILRVPLKLGKSVSPLIKSAFEYLCTAKYGHCVLGGYIYYICTIVARANMCVCGEGGYNLLIVSVPDVVFSFSLCADMHYRIIFTPYTNRTPKRKRKPHTATNQQNSKR